MNKNEVFTLVEKRLVGEGLRYVGKDDQRPWGGFFVIEESQGQLFADHYFEGMNIDHLRISGKLSPKILIVAPGQRLSWQYHHRRAEIWRVVMGEVGVIRSPTDQEGPVARLGPQESITLAQGERHRLIGLSTWAVVAEIWQHTLANHPSDEDDIIRVQDDFGR